MRTNDGKTALDLALERGETETAALLAAGKVLTLDPSIKTAEFLPT